jgi:hypothetical protein
LCRNKQELNLPGVGDNRGWNTVPRRHNPLNSLFESRLQLLQVAANVACKQPVNEMTTIRAFPAPNYALIQRLDQGRRIGRQETHRDVRELKAVEFEGVVLKLPRLCFTTSKPTNTKTQRITWLEKLETKE